MWVFFFLTVSKIVEINEHQPNEKSKGYLFRACYGTGAGHRHVHSAETQRQAEEREGFRCALAEAAVPRKL